MAVYVDKLFKWPPHLYADNHAKRVGARNGHKWCHLWADDENELHEFAARLGMKRSWAQHKPGFLHYDLTPSKRARALALGAVEGTPKRRTS